MLLGVDPTRFGRCYKVAAFVALVANSRHRGTVFGCPVRTAVTPPVLVRPLAGDAGLIGGREAVGVSNGEAGGRLRLGSVDAGEDHVVAGMEARVGRREED